MTVLVSDTWAGAGGALNGKVPTTGGGTWVNTDANANYGFDAVSCGAVGGTSVRHSASVANCRIGGQFNFAQVLPGTLWLRADSNFQNGYYARFFDGLGQSGLKTYVEIYRRVAGGNTLLIKSPDLSTGSLNAADVSFQAADSTLVVGVAGAQLLSVADATFSSGFPGFAVEKGIEGEETFDTTLGPITIETPYLDVASTAAPKNITKGQPSTVGVGYLGAADIALISQSILATLQATTIPVDVQLMNSAEVIGTGTTGDAWRGVGVLP